MTTTTYQPAQFDEIALVWRTIPGERRLVVGWLRKTEGSFEFRYDGADLEKAKALGFVGYPGFDDLDALYNGQAMRSFASRLPSRERPDYEHLIGAWGGNPRMDDFELLGSTGGRLPTDMYEFLAFMLPEPGHDFITSLVGSKHCDPLVRFEALSHGMAVNLVAEPSNAHDSNAIKVYALGQHIGYIKLVHSTSVANAMRMGIPVSAVIERLRLNALHQDVILRILFD